MFNNINTTSLIAKKIFETVLVNLKLIIRQVFKYLAINALTWEVGLWHKFIEENLLKSIIRQKLECYFSLLFFLFYFCLN